MRILMVLTVLIFIYGCANKQESYLASNQAWEELGLSQAEQGYAKFEQQRLTAIGASGVADYSVYEAGYTEGWYNYCTGLNSAVVMSYPDYLDDCTGYATKGEWDGYEFVGLWGLGSGY